MPQEGDTFHAKYANNEIYTLVPPFAETKIGLENPTIPPIPGDLLYIFFAPGTITRPDVFDVGHRAGRSSVFLRQGQFSLFADNRGSTW